MKRYIAREIYRVLLTRSIPDPLKGRIPKIRTSVPVEDESVPFGSLKNIGASKSEQKTMFVVFG